MLTERQARDLLHQAADTIDVAPGGPLDTARAPRRRWPVVAAVATAAVAALIAGALALTPHPQEGEPTPATPAGDVRVPSVLGYTADEAVAALRDLGVRATVTTQDTPCAVDGEGTVLGTSPTTEAAVAPGSSVEVVIAHAVPADYLCIHQFDTTALIRFARDLGPAPRLAPEVRIVTADGSVDLSGAQATDSAQWVVCAGDRCRSPLTALLERADAPNLYDYRKVSPGLVAIPGKRSKGLCSGHIGSGTATAIDVRGQYDGPELPCGVIDVYLDKQGRITTVDLTDEELGRVEAQPEQPRTTGIS